MKSIEEWLESIGLQTYADRFVENGIDLSVLPDLTEQDLNDIGVLVGHRRKMLTSIRDLKQTQSSKKEDKTPDFAREEAERRQLAVMFCDMVGSTALSASLDPEDMRRVIMAYHACVSAIVKSFQGMVARYMGDGVLVYFGYPQAQEDFAEQAVRAGLALIEAVADLKTGTDAAIQIRVGIATGTVVIGMMAVEGSAEQAVVGDTPNLAARLQTLAQPGTVLVCANTFRLVRGHFLFRELEPEKIRGWSEAIQFYQVLEAKRIESRFEAAHEMRVPQLVGREEEVDLLLRRWKQAKTGEGRVVMLTGEPGIGKSQITLTIDKKLQSEPHTTLRYYCSPHFVNSALHPVAAQLEWVAGFERGDSPVKRLAKLEDSLADSIRNPENVALVANLLLLPPTDFGRLPELTPQQRKEKTLQVLLAQIEQLAARQPVLIIFEDVHWIDPTSLEFLTSVVERAADLPVLLCITARPEFTPPWPSYAHTTALPLTRLSRREGSALIERVTGNKALPDEVKNEILARTDGVPLFVEELTKAILESGLLHERDNDYTLEGPLPPLAIPNTLQASLIARLDRLAPVREVAQVGAVVGREFSYELLSAVTALPKERLDAALDQLVESELIFRRGEIPEAIYTFKHSLVRDAAYSSLLKSRRAELHAIIANALERQFAEIAQSQPETLAHHFSEAGLTDKTIGYWLQAGKNAALRSSNLEAIAHLERGIEATSRLPPGEGRDRSELDLQLVLGPCLIATRGPAAGKAVGTFSRARELCERLGSPPEHLQVMFWLATASVVRGELPQALEAIAGLPKAAEALGNQPALLNGIRGQAMILMFMGRIPEARETLERAIETFNRSEEADRMAARAAGQDPGMSILAFMGWVSWIVGQVDEATKQMAAALDRAEAVQHAHTQAYALYYAAVLYALRGEPVVAQDYAQRCLALSEQHEFRQWLGLARAILGICMAERDGSAGHLEEVKGALEEYQHAGYHLGLTAQYVLLCPVLLSRSQHEAALEIIEHGLSIVNHNNERLFEAELLRLKAGALLMREAPDSEIEALLDQALRTARAQHARSLELRVATDLAKYWISRSERAKALDVLSSTYGRFSEGFETRDLKQAKLVLNQLESPPP
jgi:predicted ATPase/class 3 adenylate cyclase